MPARERESIRFVLIPFSAPPFRHPGYLSLAHNPGGSRAAAPTVVVSFHSPRSRLSPRSPPRGATSAPPTRIFKKAVSYPRSAHLHHHRLRHLRLPTLARATASPPNTAVSRHRRAFSSSFFPRVFSGPVPLFSHLRILHPLGRAATAFQITPRSPISFLFVLPFSSSGRSPAFFLLFFSRKWLTPPFTFLPPLPLICVISCFLYFSSDGTLYMHVCGG